MALVLVGLSPWICHGSIEIVKAYTVENIDKEIGEETLQIIEEYAEEYGICPELLEAICYCESGGKQYEKSSAGCVGLFQIMVKYSDYTEEELYDKRINCQECCEELMHDIEILETEDLDVILTAYNTGAYSKATKNALNGSGGNSYAKKVMRMSEMLEEIHGKYDYFEFFNERAVG